MHVVSHLPTTFQSLINISFPEIVGDKSDILPVNPIFCRQDVFRRGRERSGGGRVVTHIYKGG